MKRAFLLIGFLMLFASGGLIAQPYLFTSFHEPAKDGLRLLYSYDGYKWTDFDTTFLKPNVGNGDQVFRDPSMIQGPDGTFHLVWTTAWRGDNGFGYASSKDLVHWSEEQFLPVMANEPTVQNVWAPELFYDADSSRFIIIWASCIPGRFALGQENPNNNHRLFYTTTKDFKTFTESKLYFDPGFSVIDAVLLQKAKHRYVLVFKDNTRPFRNIRVAFSSTPIGPFANVSPAFTDTLTEGPAVVKVGKDWLIYYDAYRTKTFGAAKTRDFKTFKDASGEVSVPSGHKHGTIVKVSAKTLNDLLTQLNKK